MAENEDDDSQVRNEYQKLLDEFVAALRERNAQGSTSKWFSEDDLVDIFDYAGDLGKDYVRAEVLMWGARYFPDSDVLRERRGVFYSDVLSDNDVAEFTASNGGADTLLSALVDLRSRALGKEGTLQELKRLLDEVKDMDDEESIQFVNLAADTGNLDWLMENLPELRKHSRFEDTLMYEIGMEAATRQQYDYALRIFGEMVELSPYNATFWAALGRVQLESGDGASALESSDMALAINPDNEDALRLKARILSVIISDDATKSLHELNLKYPDDESIAEDYSSRIMRDSHLTGQRTPESIAEMQRLVKKFPGNSGIMSNYVAYAPLDVTAGYLDSLWQSSDLSNREKEWRDWADFFIANGYLDAALAVIRTVLRNQTHFQDFRFELEMDVMLSLITRRWQDTETAATRYRVVYGTYPPQIGVARIYALMHLHKYSEAYKQADSMRFAYGNKLEPAATSRSNLTNSLIGLGAETFVRDFIYTHFTRTPSKADRFDPLNLFGFKK